MTLAVLQELERSNVIASYARMPVEFVRGRGSRLWDADGEEYLDFLSGISVTNLGHCHPRIVEAVREQVGELMHVSNLFYTEPGMRLAERLAGSSLGGKVFFCNSGAEANEAAIKLARRARPGGDVVVVSGAFHGRTYGALSATPQESKQAPFAPLVPGFRAVQAEPEALTAAVDDQTAAVLLEPIQGESGVHELSAETLAAARAACDEHGAALIFDEVQCGMGRTGSLWAYRADGGRARRDDRGKGTRRRAADRRAGDWRAPCRRAAARRPRLDVRRRPGRGGGGAGGAGATTTRRCSRGSASSAPCSPRACGRFPACSRCGDAA